LYNTLPRFYKICYLFIGSPAKNINKIKPIKQVKPVLRAPAGSGKKQKKEAAAGSSALVNQTY
jgi:hypothetical protein